MDQSKQKRNKKLLEAYRNGKSLQEVADQFKVTRSRAQQIVYRQTEKDIIERFGLTYLSPNDEEMLTYAVKEEIQEIFEKTMKDKAALEVSEMRQKIAGLIEKIDKNKYVPISQFARTAGITVDTFKKYFPEIVKEVKQKFYDKWSIEFDQCQSCGTTTKPHRGFGFCLDCYTKSDRFKEVNRNSRLKNIEIRKIKEREYHKSYNKRPEIIEKQRRLNDIKNYDGNREIALRRDEYKCVFCGITQEESLQKYNRDLFVEHIDDPGDNDLSNLRTACRNCHYETMKIKYYQRPANKNGSS